MAYPFIVWIILAAAIVPWLVGLVGIILFMELRRKRRIAAGVPVAGPDPVETRAFEVLPSATGLNVKATESKEM